MNNADKQIADVLAKYDEPFAGNIWRVQGNAVIYHKCLERIAAQAKIVYDPPVVLRAERDEAVILVTGHMRIAPPGGGDPVERTEWSIGEALVNVNYRVSGKQSAYVYAMAEKRAKDRVILKLIELHGLVYSEEEADELKAPEPDGDAGREVASESGADGNASVEPAYERRMATELKRKLGSARSVDAVTDLMTHAETQRILAELPPELRDQIRDHAKSRMVALGWIPKRDKAA